MKREYYLAHKAEILAQVREYRLKNKDRGREWGRIADQKRKLYLIQWREGHRMSNRDATRRYHEKLKIEVLTRYSKGKLACVRCGFDDIRALSIDHINGGGTAQGKITGFGHHLYRWLKRNGYPDGFQTLCMNCQALKKHENKEYGNTRLE